MTLPNPTGESLGVSGNAFLEVTLNEAPGISNSQAGHLIRRLQQLAVGIFLDETALLDITPVQYAVLEALRTNPGIDQISLTRVIGVDRTTIGGVLGRLERKELVERRRSTTDRRNFLVSITDAGSELFKAASIHVERAQVRIVEPLTPVEERIFVGMMKRIVAHHNEESRTPIESDNNTVFSS